jgi:hypothetical protein
MVTSPTSHGRRRSSSVKIVEVNNKLTPRLKFFIVCGDLLDVFAKMWLDIGRQLEEVITHLDKNILVCICSNHDIDNTQMQDMVQSYNGSCGNHNFSYNCLRLNLQFYKDASLKPKLAKAQDNWLDKQLAWSKKLSNLIKVTKLLKVSKLLGSISLRCPSS